MVVKSEVSDFFAPFKASSVEDKATSIACERSVHEDARRDSRDVESQRNMNFVDSRSVHDDLEYLIINLSGVENVQSVDESMSRADSLEQRDECRVPASSPHSSEDDAETLSMEETPKKKMGLLHRVLPTLSKGDAVKNQGSGSIVTALTSKESYAMEDDQSKSVGRPDRNIPSSVSECPSRNKLSVKRLFRSSKVFQSEYGARINVDDGSVSVSIQAAMSDCEVEVEKGRKGVSLADCVTEASSVATEKRSIFGRNRSKKEAISQESTDAQSFRHRKRRDDNIKVQTGNGDAHALKKGVTNEDQHSVDNYKMKGVSLADCATEASSMVTEKRSTIGRNRSNKETISRSTTPPTSEQGQRSRHGDSFEVQSENGDSYPTRNETAMEGRHSVINYRMKGVSLADDCVTEASSVATEKRSMFGRNRSKKDKNIQAHANARLASVSSASPRASEHGQRTRRDDSFQFPNEKCDSETVGTQHFISSHEKKRASLADCLTENSSLATGKRSIFGRNRSKKEVLQLQVADTRSVLNSPASPLANEPLQQDEQDSNVVKKHDDKIAKNLAIEPKSVISDDARSGVPEFLSQDNRLEHVSSDLTFSSMPPFAHDMIRGSPSRVTKAPDLGFDQKTMPISPVSEALQFARSQAGLLKSKFDQDASYRDNRNKATLESARKDETCPSIFQSVNSPLACGINDVMSIIDPEWEDCEEFGKGKRNYQQSGSAYSVSDVVQSLRAQFACDAFGDVVNTVESGWSDRHRGQHDAEQMKETQYGLHNVSPEVTANETVAALRSLRRQLAGGDVGNNVNAHSERGDETILGSTKRASQSSLTAFGEHEPKIAHVESQPSEEEANIKIELISVSSKKHYEHPILPGCPGISNKSISMNKRNNPSSTFKTKWGRKKSNNDDESQMMSSFFSGDTPRINNHTKDATKAIVSDHAQVKPEANNVKVYHKSKETGISSDAAVSKNGVENTAGAMAEKRAQVKRLIEETLLEGEEEEEDLETEEADDEEGKEEEEEEEEEKEEERSICTAAPKQYRGTKTPVFNGTKKLRDVQLVLSASSTLELPKHKRNTVIRFATVPGDISYQQPITGTLHQDQVELGRKMAQKHLHLAKRAVISGQYMDTLDPCFRVFDPALDACDKFCTNSPSEDSDDECSIASASLCEEHKPSIGLRQRAQNFMMEPFAWPCLGRPRRMKAPCRLV